MVWNYILRPYFSADIIRWKNPLHTPAVTVYCIPTHPQGLTSKPPSLNPLKNTVNYPKIWRFLPIPFFFPASISAHIWLNSPLSSCFGAMKGWCRAHIWCANYTHNTPLKLSRFSTTGIIILWRYWSVLIMPSIWSNDAQSLFSRDCGPDQNDTPTVTRRFWHAEVPANNNYYCLVVYGISFRAFEMVLVRFQSNIIIFTISMIIYDFTSFSFVTMRPGRLKLIRSDICIESLPCRIICKWAKQSVSQSV